MKKTATPPVVTPSNPVASETVVAYPVRADLRNIKLRDTYWGQYYRPLMVEFGFSHPEALILTKLDIWLNASARNDKPKYYANHRLWVFQSLRFIAAQLPELSPQQIRTALYYLQVPHPRSGGKFPELDAVPTILAATITMNATPQPKTHWWSFSTKFIEYTKHLCQYSEYHALSLYAAVQHPTTKANYICPTPQQFSLTPPAPKAIRRRPKVIPTKVIDFAKHAANAH